MSVLVHELVGLFFGSDKEDKGEEKLIGRHSLLLLQHQHEVVPEA